MLEHFEKGRCLKNLTTIGIGGPAKYFIQVYDYESLQLVLKFCQHRLPYFILGKGSNTLFHDDGLEGLVIGNRINFLKQLDELTWHVGAGYSFSLLGTQTARQGLSGLEFASGIPGSVGGAIYMNAGANGRETCDSLVSVDFISQEGLLVTLPKSELKFDYRFSSFQLLKGAIAGATFQLEKESSARQKQLTIFNYRKQTQPYDAKSAGCIFRNPNQKHAGALIEQSGLKGKTIGGAQISVVHGNFLINTGCASSSEVTQLIELVRSEVKRATGIEMESEIRVVPFLLGGDA